MADHFNNFIIVGFTQPEITNDVRLESNYIRFFLETEAIDFFHIRKPKCKDWEVAALIDFIPSFLHSRLVLHSNFSLFNSYCLGGLHYKQESAPLVQNGVERLRITRSCHSMSELKIPCDFDFSYSFLSPIFNSISKPGYNSKFEITDNHFIAQISSRNIVALGGVTPQNFINLFKSKFAGAALLGYLWSPNRSIQDIVRDILEARLALRNIKTV